MKPKTETLNPNDFKKYEFSSKPIYLQIKTYINNHKEAVAVFKGFDGKFFTVRKKIN